jgi:hypothetical protein
MKCPNRRRLTTEMHRLVNRDHFADSLAAWLFG